MNYCIYVSLHFTYQVLNMIKFIVKAFVFGLLAYALYNAFKLGYNLFWNKPILFLVLLAGVWGLGKIIDNFIS